MASKKPKYNPEDVERWVTVRGARIPIMKDGSFGVGTKSHTYSLDKRSDNNFEITNPEKGTRYTVTAKDEEDARTQISKAQRSGKIDQFDYPPENIYRTTSKNAKYDTSRSSKKVSAREAKAVADLMGTKKRRDGEVVPHYLSEYSDEAMIQHLNKVQPKQGYEWKIDRRIQDTIYGKYESRYFKRVSKKK